MTKLDWERANRRAISAKRSPDRKGRSPDLVDQYAIDEAYRKAEAEREANLPPEVRRRKAKEMAREKKREKDARKKKREEIESSIRQWRSRADAAAKRALEKSRRLRPPVGVQELKLVKSEPDRSARLKRCFKCGNTAPIGQYLPSEVGMLWRKCPACGMNFSSEDFDN
ncbi:MAG: hypothetical protein NT159_06130 [Proteobacteria bacterium]|nr:hypothetical protein [Pseudomonadota bacterium]